MGADVSIFETKDQKELAAQRAEMMHAAAMQQQLMQHREMLEQQKMAAAAYNYNIAAYNGAISGSGLQAPPSPSKINEALDFKDWVRDTLPDVWDQYRAVKDIERCSK